MAIHMKVKIPNLKRLPFRIQRATKNTAREAIVQADAAVYELAEEQITTQGAVLGTPWRKLRPFTVNRRAKRYRGTYYRKPSAQGPTALIGVWQGNLREEAKKPGSINRQALKSTRKYEGGTGADRSAKQRLHYLHLGRKDNSQVARPVFVMKQGGKMPKTALRDFADRFALKFPIEMRKP